MLHGFCAWVGRGIYDVEYSRTTQPHAGLTHRELIGKLGMCGFSNRFAQLLMPDRREHNLGSEGWYLVVQLQTRPRDQS